MPLSGRTKINWSLMCPCVPSCYLSACTPSPAGGCEGCRSTPQPLGQWPDVINLLDQLPGTRA
jgi:hypothetical protein